MNLNELAKEAHQIAVEHGWWEKEPSFGDLVDLMHSELSEALEEYRAGRDMVWYACTEGTPEHPCDPKDIYDCEMSGQEASCAYRSEKPEGIAVELADCIIRILDWMGKEQMDADKLMYESTQRVMPEVPKRINNTSFGNCISRWHLLLSLGYVHWCREPGEYAALRIALCMAEILDWAGKEGVDMEAIIREKMEYNKTRPYRHGGKLL